MKHFVLFGIRLTEKTLRNALNKINLAQLLNYLNYVNIKIDISFFLVLFIAMKSLFTFVLGINLCCTPFLLYFADNIKLT